MTRVSARSFSVGLAVAALGVLAGIDLSLPREATVAGALVVVPFLAATGGTPAIVGILGSASTILAVGLAVADGSGIHASATRIVMILVGTIVATQMASARQRRERRLVDLSAVAEVAQRAIIADPGPLVGSVAIAVRYQSSTRAATVGGDCFEALDTRHGTRLLLGDVRGHGLPAVRLCALILGAFRALAHLEPDLARIAGELDHLAARFTAETDGDLGMEEFVTAVLVEVCEDRVTVANCGHPPPLVLSPDGEIATLEARHPTLPLALGAEPKLQTISVRPGTRLLLYTDGIIESRNRTGAFFDLRAAVARLAQQPMEAILDGLILELKQHADSRILDDVALLVFEPLAQADRQHVCRH